MRDRGSMLVVTVLVGVAFTAAVLLAVEPVLEGLVDRQRARAAADAAALAGVTSGRAGAAGLAAANGGVLVSWSEYGDEVTVVVEVDGQRATARATDAP
ncbi:MAG TPA: pilus assembly protein TadG-related protein [Ilumatobacter sp.]|nr:pilus assembly protein TadG-related protein [Ilumatobacter sp.]